METHDYIPWCSRCDAPFAGCDHWSVTVKARPLYTVDVDEISWCLWSISHYCGAVRAEYRPNDDYEGAVRLIKFDDRSTIEVRYLWRHYMRRVPNRKVNEALRRHLVDIILPLWEKVADQ